MAFTDFCNVFVSAHEDGFNKILRHMAEQRPTLFNYGTQWFANATGRLCHEIRAHPEVTRRGNPLITVEDPLPIPGTNGLYGVDFCIQLVEANIDFFPENSANLPGELDPLPRQHVALHARFCVGIRCPNPRLAEDIGDGLANEPPKDPKDERPGDAPRPPITPIPGEKVQCFCLDIYATLQLERLVVSGIEHIVLRLEGFEIVDIKPEELENALECYVAAVLRVGILPKMRIAVDTMAFELGAFMTLTAGLTPISANVPHNPAVEDDQAKLFIDLGVS